MTLTLHHLLAPSLHFENSAGKRALNCAISNIAALLLAPVWVPALEFSLLNSEVPDLLSFSRNIMKGIGDDW